MNRDATVIPPGDLTEQQEDELYHSNARYIGISYEELNHREHAGILLVLGFGNGKRCGNA